MNINILKVGALTMDLDLGIISESEKRLKKKLILDYIYSNLKHHNFWAYRYFFCEFLALINVVGKNGKTILPTLQTIPFHLTTNCTRAKFEMSVLRKVEFPTLF